MLHIPHNVSFSAVVLFCLVVLVGIISSVYFVIVQKLRVYIISCNIDCITVDEDGVRYVPVRPRPPITHLRQYRNPWKAAYHHFQRYSDIKVKGRNKHSVCFPSSGFDSLWIADFKIIPLISLQMRRKEAFRTWPIREE